MSTATRESFSTGCPIARASVAGPRGFCRTLLQSLALESSSLGLILSARLTTVLTLAGTEREVSEGSSKVGCLNQLMERRVECPGDSQHRHDGRVVIATLDPAHVAPVHLSQKSQLLLRYAELLSLTRHSVAKRQQLRLSSVFW